MPESASRKKPVYTPPSDTPLSRKPVKIGSPRWLAPTMVAFFLLGLAWIVAYYIAPTSPPFAELTYWNVVIGFGFIGIGFAFSTKWK